MKFILMVTNVEGYWERQPKEEGERVFGLMMAYERELASHVKILHSARFRLSGSAKTVHAMPDGRLVVKDGPFTEGNESMAGFHLIECGSIDEAVEWAKKMPLVPNHSVEVRPIWEE